MLWPLSLAIRVTLAWPPLEVSRKFRTPPVFVTVAFASVDELFMFTLEMFVMLALPADAVPGKIDVRARHLKVHVVQRPADLSSKNCLTSHHQ